MSDDCLGFIDSIDYVDDKVTLAHEPACVVCESGSDNYNATYGALGRPLHEGCVPRFKQLLRLRREEMHARWVKEHA